MVDGNGTACGTASCATLPVATIEATGECSATCGGGLQGTFTLTLGVLGSLLNASAGSATCSDAPCPSFYWQLDDWTPCSVPCGGGLQSRQPTCMDASTGAPVGDATLCAPLDAPLNHTCNTAACDFNLWLVGGWSACSEGLTWRSVSCVSSSGVQAPDTRCLAPKPVAAAACGAAVTTPSAGLPACASGVSDATGACCPVGATLDAVGACCASGTLDACGVCNGTGQAVAVDGSCCPGLLDVGGLCCVGQLDALGVCNGGGTTGNLALNVTVQAPGGSAAAWAVASARALADVLGVR